MNPGPPDYIVMSLISMFYYQQDAKGGFIGAAVRQDQLIEVFVIHVKEYDFFFFSAAGLVILSSVLLSDRYILLLQHSLYYF